MKTTLGRTPLHVSAAQNRGSIVDVLLNNGKVIQLQWCIGGRARQGEALVVPITSKKFF